MRIITPDQANQGSPLWWDLRRGIVTGSRFPSILTPVTGKPSTSQKALIAALCGEVSDPANNAPGWCTERFNKPPNLAIEEGVRREAESRAWLAMERTCHIEQVGFCLADNGLYGCSPDGLIVADSGCLDAALELKNPMAETQAGYLLDGRLPPEYRCQVHGHLIVTGLRACVFCSYHHDFPDKLVIEITRDDFTARLEEELDAFCARYLAALDRLGLRKRWEFLRQNCLAHFPPEAA